MCRHPMEHYQMGRIGEHGYTEWNRAGTDLGQAFRQAVKYVKKNALSLNNLKDVVPWLSLLVLVTRCVHALLEHY